MNRILHCDWLPQKNFPEKHVINSLFASLWTSTLSRSINTQKNNLANILPSYVHTLSILVTQRYMQDQEVTQRTHVHTFSPLGVMNGTALPCLCKEAITISRVSSSNFLQRVLSTFHGMMWSVVSHSTQLKCLLRTQAAFS